MDQIDPNLSAYALKKQNTYGGALMDRLSGLLGGSAVKQTQAAPGRAYQLYVMEQQALGLPPDPPEVWAMKQGGGILGSK